MYCSRQRLGDTGFRRTHPRLCTGKMRISWGRAPWQLRSAGTLRSPLHPVPEQLMPSPVYPGRHSQAGWPPARIRQRARSPGAHGWLPSSQGLLTGASTVGTGGEGG